MIEKEFLCTFAVKCSLYFSQGCQIASFLKNKNAFALWNCIDTHASRLMFLEETQSSVRYCACFWWTTSMQWRTVGWCSMYNGIYKRSLDFHVHLLYFVFLGLKFLCLQTTLVYFTKGTSLLLKNHLGWRKVIQLRIMCFSIVSKCH